MGRDDGSTFWTLFFAFLLTPFVLAALVATWVAVAWVAQRIGGEAGFMAWAVISGLVVCAWMLASVFDS